MYCCNVFKRMIENVGKDGFSIAVCEWQGITHFWLQVRGLKAQEYLYPNQTLKKFDSIRHITLAEGKYVKHCPHCGRKTLALIKKYPERYRALVEEHKMFVSEIGDINEPPESSSGISIE